MTPIQVKMPEQLTVKDLQSIAYVYSKMSLASKQSFLSGIIMYHPEHFIKIVESLEQDYLHAMAQA